MTAAMKWGLGWGTAHNDGTRATPFTVKMGAVDVRENVCRLYGKRKGGGSSPIYEIYLLRSSMNPL